MSDVLKLFADLIRSALNIRPSIELEEGNKIQTELNNLKKDIEKELQNKDHR